MATSIYPAYPRFGTLGDVGLGANISAHLDSPENSWLKDRFAKYGAGDARSRFAWLVLAYRASNLEGHYVDTVPIEPKMLEPNGVNVRPEDPFWLSSPKRKEIHDRLVKMIPTVPVNVTTTFDPIGAIAKIPILGPVLKAAVAPITLTVSLAQGERFDHALLDVAKNQLSAIKAVAPYAATVVSFIPGIGTGVAAAIAAGAALAEGKPIDQALEEAIKSAIPGGALAVSGFELAKKVASGQNVGKAMLETARSQLPKEAQKAFDIGLAVVSGKQIQDAITSAIVSLAPDEIKQILDTGTKALQAVPGLAAIAKALPTDVARQGLQLASGALARAGVNESQIKAMRSKLTGDVLKGFDAALKAQAQHFPWAENVVAHAPSPVSVPTPTQAQLDLQALAKLSPAQRDELIAFKKAQDDLQKLAQLSPEQRKQLVDAQNAKASKPTATPKPRELPAKAAAGKPSATPKPLELPRKSAAAAPSSPASIYGPYPKMVGGALNGPPPTCRALGAPIAVMAPGMRRAGQSAVYGSGGRPRMVRSPDGADYLFMLENGALTARECFS